MSKGGCKAINVILTEVYLNHFNKASDLELEILLAATQNRAENPYGSPNNNNNSDELIDLTVQAAEAKKVTIATQSNPPKPAEGNMVIVNEVDNECYCTNRADSFVFYCYYLY